MKGRIRRFTVDFYRAEDPPPEPGQIVREVRHTGEIRGYARVLSARPMKVRVTRGEAARYALRVERLPARPPEPVAFTVTSYPPRPRIDRFSPLLPPVTEVEAE